MSEYQILYAACAALVGMVVYCLCWALGGRSGKWKRRYLGAVIMSGTLCGISAYMGMWNIWLLLLLPCLIIGSSMGYGDKGTGKTSVKIIRRLLFTCGMLLSGLVFCFVFGGNAWIVFVAHAGVALWSIWLGVKNPLHASAEEVIICSLHSLLLNAYPFIIK